MVQLWTNDSIYELVSEDGMRSTGYTQAEVEGMLRKIRDEYEWRMNYLKSLDLRIYPDGSKTGHIG